MGSLINKKRIIIHRGRYDVIKLINQNRLSVINQKTNKGYVMHNLCYLYLSHIPKSPRYIQFSVNHLNIETRYRCHHQIIF